MSRIRITLLLFILAVLPLQASAETDSTMFNINGEAIRFSAEDGTPYINEKGRTMVSVDFFKSMDFHVNETDQQVSFTNPAGIESVWTIDQSVYQFMGESVSLKTSARIHDGTIYLPLREAVAPFGDTHWDADTRTISVVYDYSAFIKPILATVGEWAPTFDFHWYKENDISAGTPIGSNGFGTLLYAEHYEDGPIKAITDGKKTLIHTVNENYVIRHDAYYVDEHAMIWIEYPLNGDGSWYIYEKASDATDGVKEIYRGSFADILNIQDIMSHFSVSERHIAFLGFDEKAEQINLYLINRHTGEQSVLDTLTSNHVPSRASFSNGAVFWSKGAEAAPQGGLYSKIYRYDLHTKETTVMFPGCNLHFPVINGDYMLVQFKPDGHNFIPTEQQYIAAEIWCYDLRSNKWAWRVDNTLPIYDVAPGDIDHLNEPRFISDEIVTYRHASLANENVIPIVNCKTGQVSAVRNLDGKAMKTTNIVSDTLQDGIFNAWHVNWQGDLLLQGHDTNGRQMMGVYQPPHGLE